MVMRYSETPAGRVALTDSVRDQEAIVWKGNRPVTRAVLFGDAARLADSLPEQRYVANYCTDRYYFIMALLAAIGRNQVSILPIDRTSSALAFLAEQFPGLYGLSDTPISSDLIEVRTIGSSDFDPNGSGEFPIVEPDQIVAHTYTSGTTGRAVAHAKTWGALMNSARLIAAAVGLSADNPPVVVATVPAQHMYGLETSIMLPLASKAVVHAGHPFYPADIVDALEAVPEPRILVTTPIHLHALVKEFSVLPKLDLIISATDSLSVALAARAEELYKTFVYEIFGCTEAGSLASRRTVEGETWHVFEGYALALEAGRSVLRGPQLATPVKLQDILELKSPSEFALRGRMTDMIKVAGKRASLAGLNAILLEIDGVLDGAFYLPPGGDVGRTARLVAIAVAPERSAADIGRELRQRLDPAFVPRRVIRVPAMPRNTTGKLTTEALRNLAGQRPGDGK